MIKFVNFIFYNKKIINWSNIDKTQRRNKWKHAQNTVKHQIATKLQNILMQCKSFFFPQNAILTCH